MIYFLIKSTLLKSSEEISQYFIKIPLTRICYNPFIPKKKNLFPPTNQPTTTTTATTTLLLPPYDIQHAFRVHYSIIIIFSCVS